MIMSAGASGADRNGTAPLRVQRDPLPFQQDPLDQLPARRCAGADPSCRIHDPMPGHDATLRQRVEGIPNLAGMTGESRERRHLSVRRYPALGNPPHHPINPLVAHQAAESGAPLHAGCQEHQPGHDRDASGPGGNCLLRLHRSLHVANLENLVPVRVADASEYHEGSEDEEYNPDESLRSHERLQSLRGDGTGINRGVRSWTTRTSPS